MALGWLLLRLAQAPAGTARILVTVSTSALMAAKFIGIYSISKYALLGLTETLAAELAPEGIGVTARMPGPVRTTHSLSSETARPKELPGARPLKHQGSCCPMFAALFL